MNIQSDIDQEQRSTAAGTAEQVGREFENLRREGEERLAELSEATSQMRQQVEEAVKKRPLVSVSAAFGAGALIGAVAASKLARLIILAAGGYMVREMFGDRISELIEAMGESREKRGGTRWQQEPTTTGGAPH